MGLFDIFSKKEPSAPQSSDSPPAPPQTDEGVPQTPRPAPLDEATRVLNETAQSITEAAKPLGEAMKPLGEAAKVQGKSFVDGLSSATRDIGGALRDMTNTPPTASATETPDMPPPAPPFEEQTPTASTSPNEPSVSPTISSQPQSSANEAKPVADVDAFNPFAGMPPLDEPLPQAPASAVAHPVPSIENAALASPPDTLTDEGHLEEYQEPLTTQAPVALESGTKLTLSSKEGTPVEIEITSALPSRGALNVYRAQTSDSTPLIVREAEQGTAASARIERENTARGAIDSPQIPLPVAYGTQNERVYLADSGVDTEKTFASQLEGAAPLADQIFTLTQTSAALSQLHKAGFLHGALRPEAIILSRPVRLSGFESLSPLGQKSDSVSSFAGYGAPEIIAGEPLDARTDVYSVGALLHRILTGQGVPETGWDDSTFAPAMLLPGAPQILAKTLGPPASRYSDMSALHRDLVRLRARLRSLARHESVGETTIGLEWGRTTNQDAWGEMRGQQQGENGAVEWTAWVVSDGMGGMASGEVASQAAVGAVLREAGNWGVAFKGNSFAEAEQASVVKNWAREANRQAVDEMNRIGARGGCTLVCGLVVDRRLTLAHVGDCRVYLWRDGALTQLTRDHSFVMSLVLQGEITREQMREHPDRSKITRSLGDRHPMPDYFVDGLDVETKSPSLELQKDDVLLAFSDGVWEPVVESEMSDILTNASSLEEAAHELVDAAMREGGPDNATVYLFKMSESAPFVVHAHSQETGTLSSTSSTSLPPLPSDRPTL